MEGEKNTGIQKDSTAKQVISYIVRNGAASRKEIAEKIGVTGATLTRVAASLIDQKLLLEVGTVEEGKVGRKQVMLDVYDDACFAVGFDVTSTSIRVTLLNIKNTVVEEKSWNFSVLTQTILETAIGYTSCMIKKYECKKILGMGLLMQGYIEDDLCYSLPIVDIKEQLKGHFSLDIYMMNNVKGLAVAEYYFGNTSKNFLLIKYGPGVGGVVVVDGEILKGYRNRAGEIGHIIWDPQSQRQCKVCGKKGCLESLIHFDALVKRANPNMCVEIADIAAVIKAGKNDENRAISDAITNLSTAANIFIDILDPEEVFLAGDIFQIEGIYAVFVSSLVASNQTIKAQRIHRIKDYREKSEKAAGIIVLNEYFGKGIKTME